MQHFIVWITWTITLGVLSWFIAGAAYGNDSILSEERIAEGIERVSPNVRPERAERLAFEIGEAARETELDPLLLVAIIRRESAFSRDFESLRVLGDLGEMGLMQTHGVALEFRPQDCPYRLRGARCQIRTGARFLAYVRDRCGGTKNRWVASYGMSRCATERRAARHHTVLQARRHYYQAGGRSW